MNQHLPRTLIIFLACLASGSFAVSLHLEHKHLDWLQAHPIMVNLLSGIVGFSTATLVLAVGLSWFVERNRIRAKSSDLYNALTDFVMGLNSIARMLPDRVFPDSVDESKRLIENLLKLRGVRRQDIDEEEGDLEPRDMMLLVPYSAKLGVLSRLLRSAAPTFTFEDGEDERFREQVLRWLEKVDVVVRVFELDDVDDVSAPAHRVRRMVEPTKFGNAYNVSRAYDLLQDIVDGVYGHRIVKRYLAMYPYMKSLWESKTAFSYPA